MQEYKPLNKFNLINFTIFKSLYISLQLCFLIYSLKTSIEISINNYTYLIFTLGLNLLLDLFQVLEHAIACYYFYNKEFIDNEDYLNKKLLLRINNNFYYFRDKYIESPWVFLQKYLSYNICNN